MKRSILAVVLLLASTNVFPQVGIGMGFHIPLNGNSSHQQGQNIQDEVQRMKNDLALDSSQVIKVRSLLVERDRRRSHKEPMTGQEYDSRIREILDADQYNKFAGKRHQKTEQRTAAVKDTTLKQPDQKKDWDDVYK